MTIVRKNSKSGKSTPSQKSTKSKVKPAEAKPKPAPMPMVESPSAPTAKPAKKKLHRVFLWSGPERSGERIRERPGRSSLEATTQTRAEVKPGETCYFGVLVKYYFGARRRYSGRPFLLIQVPGVPGPRYWPWRFDWPVSIETASLQPKDGEDHPGKFVWLLLNPAHLAASQEVWKTAKAELDAWSAARKAKGGEA
jgi:hypothetical protein